ncbi:MAG TPA: Dabb family protein [Bryobacteraceae bacterium]|nr:Dabb family protein [Bryobacteraceae bacterium]
MRVRNLTLALAGAALLFIAGIAVGANRFSKPKTVLHVVTIKWKDDATADQKQAAIEGVDKMAAEIPGITRIWTKPLKVQGEGFSGAFVIEFADQAAFDKYASNPAHKAWEKLYLPIRGESVTHDISN